MRRLLPLCAVRAALALPAPASAIVNGEAAAQGEFPSHGLLLADNNEFPGFDRFCGGTLIGSRQFLTAANCVADGAVALPVGKLVVRLGNIARNASSPDAYGVTNIELAPGYKAAPFPANDAAVLTLDRVADYEPTRVLDAGETDLWDAGAVGTIVGWGGSARPTTSRRTCARPTCRSPTPRAASTATAPPATCSTRPRCCARPTRRTRPSARRATAARATRAARCSSATRTSCPRSPASSRGCAAPAAGTPRVRRSLTRLGDGALNTWVHSRTPEADFTLSHQPRAGEPVTLENDLAAPGGRELLHDLPLGSRQRRALRRRHRRDDLAHLPPGRAGGRRARGVTPGGDKASIYYAFEVEPAPVVAPPPGGGTPTTPATPPTVGAPTATPLATILVNGRPKVRNRRFAIRVRFAADAPRGTAVIEVYRGNRRIGIARTKVARGATKRVRVKLTPQGRRMLRRAETKRLKIRVRVRVGREILRTKRLTIRR